MPAFLSRLTLTLALALPVAAAQAAEINLYEHAEFAGRSIVLRETTPSLNPLSFNDRVSSAVVISGRWELCSEEGHKGQCIVLTRGHYPTLERRLNDRISSARDLDATAPGAAAPTPGAAPVVGGQPARALLYREEGGQGAPLVLNTPAPDLAMLDHDEITQSLQLEGTAWELCPDAGYRGQCKVVQPGRYPSLRGLGMFMTLSSLRPVMPATQGGAVSASNLPGPPAPPRGGIELYAEPNFAGRNLLLQRDTPNLREVDFNDRIGALVINTGRWELCTDSGYRGRCTVLGPGRYPQLGDLSGKISSLRLLGAHH